MMDILMSFDADSIARHLESAGVRGRCPLSRYLKIRIPFYNYMLVNNELIELPPSFKLFVNKFDNGDYPNLE